jgi:hypothetical protein
MSSAAAASATSLATCLTSHAQERAQSTDRAKDTLQQGPHPCPALARLTMPALSAKKSRPPPELLAGRSKGASPVTMATSDGTLREGGARQDTH